MIILTEIAKKLENILNDEDEETSGITRPFDFRFAVATQGFHIDFNHDRKTGKNFIPVFIETMGGQFDAVKGLKRATITVPVSIYFPVRFKDIFYQVNEFLNECFVATQLNYGTLTGKCLANVSVATYGEIQDIDLKQFIGWVGSTYQEQIDVMEKYMSMTFTLYLTTSGEDFLYGNQIEYILKYTYKAEAITLVELGGGTYIRDEYRDLDIEETIEDETVLTHYFAFTQDDKVIYTKTDSLDYYRYVNNVMVLGGGFVPTTRNVEMEDKLTWTSSGTGASISPISQQLIDIDNYAKNVPNITNYNKSVLAYVKDNDFWRILLAKYNNQELNSLSEVKLVKKYNFKAFSKEFVYNQIILSVNENVALGELISFTITFGDGE